MVGRGGGKKCQEKGVREGERVLLPTPIPGAGCFEGKLGAKGGCLPHFASLIKLKNWKYSQTFCHLDSLKTFCLRRRVSRDWDISGVKGGKERAQFCCEG